MIGLTRLGAGAGAGELGACVEAEDFVAEFSIYVEEVNDGPAFET